MGLMVKLWDLRWVRYIICLGMVYYMAVYDYRFYFSPREESGEKQFVINAGEPFNRIAHRLVEEGVIRSYNNFVFEARISGATTKIKAGEYIFREEKRAREVLAKLVRGEVVQYSVTLPEGVDIYDIAELLEEKGLASKKRFLLRAINSELLNSLGIEGASAEGYLFPDTYIFTKGLDEDVLIRRMAERFHQVFTPSMELRARSLGMSVGEVVTLASIIEKEALMDRERPIISGVFHNRLRRGMRLQSDPTAVYDLPGFEGRITWAHLKRRSNYNTYYVDGLPAGPIGNPGRNSLIAALYPAEIGYLYFVSKNDGTHFFSTNLKDHNRAVARYQR